MAEIDKQRVAEARKIQQESKIENEQYVTISLEQYTDWMLKAHTITQIQKIYDKIDDYECITEAVGALINK